MFRVEEGVMIHNAEVLTCHEQYALSTFVNTQILDRNIHEAQDLLDAFTRNRDYVVFVHDSKNMRVER